MIHRASASVAAVWRVRLGDAAGHGVDRGPADHASEVAGSRWAHKTGWPAPAGQRERASIRATSSGLSEKRTTSMLAAIRSGCADFTSTVIPCSRCQRSTTWEAVASWAAAILASTGLARLVRLSGLYPSTATPRSRWPASSAASYLPGLHEIWLTAGGWPVASISRSIWASE